jgi:hypothetical protein
MAEDRKIFNISIRTVGDGVATSSDGNWDSAEPTLASAFAAVPPAPGAAGPAPELRRRIELFAALCGAERYGEAVAVGAEIVAYHRRYYGGYHQRTVRWAGRLGEAYLRAGDPVRAAPLLDAARTALASLRGEDDPETAHYRRLHDTARAAPRGPDQPEDVP